MLFATIYDVFRTLLCSLFLLGFLCILIYFGGLFQAGLFCFEATSVLSALVTACSGTGLRSKAPWRTQVNPRSVPVPQNIEA